MHIFRFSSAVLQVSLCLGPLRPGLFITNPKTLLILFSLVIVQLYNIIFCLRTEIKWLLQNLFFLHLGQGLGQPCLCLNPSPPQSCKYFCEDSLREMLHWRQKALRDQQWVRSGTCFQEFLRNSKARQLSGIYRWVRWLGWTGVNFFISTFSFIVLRKGIGVKTYHLPLELCQNLTRPRGESLLLGFSFCLHFDCS